jgi:hypothetical protein
MTDPVDATLAAYQSRAHEYLRATAWPASELITYLDRFASLARPGPVLEIGSGPGRDADYLEGHGVRVIRTDATPVFVTLLRAAGHEAQSLDARTESLGGPYRGILANAVLHHLNRRAFRSRRGRPTPRSWGERLRHERLLSFFVRHRGSAVRSGACPLTRARSVTSVTPRAAVTRS